MKKALLIIAVVFAVFIVAIPVASAMVPPADQPTAPSTPDTTMPEYQPTPMYVIKWAVEWAQYTNWTRAKVDRWRAVLGIRLLGPLPVTVGTLAMPGRWYNAVESWKAESARRLVEAKRLRHKALNMRGDRS